MAPTSSMKGSFVRLNIWLTDASLVGSLKNYYFRTFVLYIRQTEKAMTACRHLRFFLVVPTIPCRLAQSGS